MKFSAILIAILLVITIKSEQISAQWTQANGPFGAKAQCIAVSGSNIFVGTFYGMFRSNNNGGLWTEVNNGLTTTNITALAVSGNNIFAGTSKGIFLSTDNGQTL